MCSWKKSIRAAGAFAAALLAAPLFGATNFLQTNLVADEPGAAAQTDPNMVGTWGISTSNASPFWVSNTSNGTSTVFSSTGVPNAMTVPTISATVAVVPPSAINKGKTGTPTGQVNNGYGAGNFELSAGRPASFIFATLDGTISGWANAQDPRNAVVMVDNGANGAIYTGLGIGVSSVGPTLYAANFGNGRIDTFDKTYKPVNLPGGFIDLDLPGGYAPSNIQRFGQRLYVTYNLPDGNGGFVGGPSTGLVNVFDVDGNLLQHLIPTSAYLNVPWGLALAGPNFGVFSYALLVGNFGDGTISAFDPITGNYLGTMQDGKGNNISIDGLWGIQFGNGGNGGDATTLYFAAAPAGGLHGLFGGLRPMADSVLP